METVELAGNLRTKTGKGAAKQFRRNGLIPGTVYGNKENLLITIDNKNLFRLLKKAQTNAILNLKIENNKNRNVVIKEMQKDIITRDILHVDLLEISMKKKLKIAVPIEETGTAIGTKMGGVLTYLVRDIKVECLPENIPQTIKVDVTGLDIGHSLHIRNITIPDGVTVLDNPDDTVCVLKIVEAEKSKEAEEGAAETEVAAEAGAETPADDKEKASGDKDKPTEGKDKKK